MRRPRKKPAAKSPDERGEATPEQLEARRELHAIMRRHNPEPTAEELAEVDRQWDHGD